MKIFVNPGLRMHFNGCNTIDLNAHNFTKLSPLINQVHLWRFVRNCTDLVAYLSIRIKNLIIFPVFEFFVIFILREFLCFLGFIKHRYCDVIVYCINSKN